MDQKIILRDALILRPGEKPLDRVRGDIYIDGEILAAMEGEGDPFPDSVADEVLDLTGFIIMPGLINTHTHTPLTYLRGVAQDVGLADFFQCLAPYTHLISREHTYWSSLLAQAEMIRNGITTFVDSFEWMEEVGRAVVDSGLRAILVSEIGGIRPTAEAQNATAYSIGSKAYDFYEEYGSERLSQALESISSVQSLNCNRLTNRLGPHALYSCSSSLLTEIAQHARRMDLAISIHLAEEQELEHQIRQRHGSSATLLRETGLLEIPCLGVHGVYLDDRDIDQLQGTGFAVAHCLGSNLKLGEKTAPIAKFLERGIPIGLGTDSVLSNDNLDILEEARMAALVHKGAERDPSFLSGDVALQMATVMGAKSLGIEDKLGRLTPGYLADLIVLEPSSPHWVPAPDPMMSLLYAAHTSDVVHVMVNGKWVMKDRVILTIDEQEVFARAWQAVRS